MTMRFLTALWSSSHTHLMNEDDVQEKKAFSKRLLFCQELVKICRNIED